MRIIRKHATGKLTDNGLECRGTDVNQVGDVLADVLLLVPKHIKHVGFVSYSVYLQAKEIYDKYYLDLYEDMESVTLSGHSLGAGICRIIAIMLRLDGYEGEIHIVGKGGVKALSRKAESWLFYRVKSDSWIVNHRDPIPFLGWWSMPLSVEYRGESHKHLFDWDMAEHMNYWS